MAITVPQVIEEYVSGLDQEIEKTREVMKQNQTYLDSLMTRKKECQELLAEPVKTSNPFDLPTV